MAIMASTGRTGSTFLFHLFRRSPVANDLHGGLGTRLDRALESPDEMLAAYLARVTGNGACVHLETNPRFFESVAARHSITDPCEIVRLLQAHAVQVRILFMTRDPRSYAVSIKNRWRELGREYQPAPKALSPATFEATYGVPRQWLRDQDEFGHVCASWLLRNRFLSRLMVLPECRFLRFEDIFDGSVSDVDFVRRIQDIHDHFQLPGYTTIDELLVERRQPRNATNRVEALTDDEAARLRAMCGAEAAEWGYTL